ncbi:hypothetical protein BpHYR1_018322 [Brachionus plicatilis]|uniref:Uncharacterized protein n=1 Tax=Brachionus plicatilis TaxID=10195 RepID=A0A3M7PK81_BRAPC|nr:hypothetical protein BpHYR1_018322 [Brachionus plicatilis]
MCLTRQKIKESISFVQTLARDPLQYDLVILLKFLFGSKIDNEQDSILKIIFLNFLKLMLSHNGEYQFDEVSPVLDPSRKGKCEILVQKLQYKKIPSSAKTLQFIA